VGAVSTDPRLGTELAGYRLEALIGRGGMGVVYRAHDLALDRDVALKLLAPELADDVSFRERFLRESRLAASLEHPNVVPIHDAGEIEGQLYIAMRLVEGTDLKTILREGPLEPARAVHVVEQIAGALDAAHARGLVHRDVKPSNVLIDEREHVYLADFGLSRRLGDAAAPLGAAKSLGTADYVAPEQIRGEEVDGRADVYALGCLLYECLAGKPPFERGSEAATLYAHLEESPPVLPGLEQVLPKALAKEPGDRYQSSGNLTEAAREALGLGSKRFRWPLAAAVVGLLLIAAAVAAYFAVSGGGGAAPAGDSLLRIDPSTGRVVDRITVGRNPTAVAVDGGGAWIANHDDGSVWRIDGRTNRVVLRVPAHGVPADLAVGGSNTIVANGPGDLNVNLIDRTTGAANVISLATGGPVFGAPRVAAGVGGFWVAQPDRVVGRLDTDAGKLVNPLLLAPPRDERADSFFSGIAVGGGSVWVVGDPLDRTLWRIDSTTGKLAATIRLPFAPTDVAVGAGAVWVTSQLDDTLSRIDPSTSAITATIPVGRGAGGLAVGAGSVWVAETIDRAVSRVDPRTVRLVDTIPVGSRPDDLAAGRSGVWVAAHRL
jgi:YVTN family beta-propeller protein